MPTPQKYNKQGARSVYVAALAMNWLDEMGAKGELHPNFDCSSKGQIRFTTDTTSAVIPDAAEADSGWGTRNHYFYEIVNDRGKYLSMQMVISGHNLSEELRTVFDTIEEAFPAASHVVNWKWRTPFVTGDVPVADDMHEKEIIQVLCGLLEKVRLFEQELTETFREGKSPE